MVTAKQRGHTLQEQQDDDPYKQPNEQSEPGQTIVRVGFLLRTIKDGAEEVSGEPGLLVIVQLVCDHWGIEVVGPRLFLRAGHGPDLHEE